MENLDTNSVAAGLDGSSSHISALEDISHDLLDLSPFLYRNHETYVDDGSCHTQRVDPIITSTEISQADQGTEPPQYLELTSIISDVASDPAQYSFTSNPSMPFGEPSSSQANGINPFLVQFDTESFTLSSPPSPHPTTPFYSAHTTPGSVGWGLPATIDVSTLLGREDPEIEREDPFKHPRLFEIAPPVKEGEHNALGGEEGEEGACSTSSSAGQPQGSASPDNPTTRISDGKGEEGGREAETAVDKAIPDLQCPGISGETEAEKDATLADLLKTAGESGAEDRKVGLCKLTQDGKTSTCIECGKAGRRDRLLAHVLYEHLELKTWTCPLCQKSYATRDALKQHLKAIKVACLCEKDITKNNWYEHAKTCKACLAVAGGTKITQGRVVAVRPTVAQAEPSVRDPSPEGEGLADPPQAPTRRPVVVQDVSKKRKNREDDDSSGDEFKEGRNPKRVKRNRT